MKKKIALLLAGVMALSTLPMSVFAADTTTSVRVPGILNANSSRSKTILASDTMPGLTILSTSYGRGLTTDGYVPAGIAGADGTIDTGATVPKKYTDSTAKLTAARTAFADVTAAQNDLNAAVAEYNKIYDYYTANNESSVATEVQELFTAAGTRLTAVMTNVGATFNGGLTTVDPVTVKIDSATATTVGADLAADTVIDGKVEALNYKIGTYAAVLTPAQTLNTGDVSTARTNANNGGFDVATSPVVTVSGLQAKANAQFEVTLTNGASSAEWGGKFVGLDGGTADYTAFDSYLTNAINTNSNVAVKAVRNPNVTNKIIVTVLETTASNDDRTVQIPVVGTAGTNAEPLMVSVKALDNNTNVVSSTATVASVSNDTTGGNTTTKITDQFSGKNNLTFDVLTSENVSGTFGSGYVADSAANKREDIEKVTYTINSNFEFQGFENYATDASFNLETSGALDAYVQVPSSFVTTDYGVDCEVWVKRATASNKLYVEYRFDQTRVTTPTTTPASVKLRGLTIAPKSSASLGQEVTMSITPDTNSEISKQDSLVVGNYSDYAFSSSLFESNKEVPALQSGRMELTALDAQGNYVADDADVFGDNTVTVKLADNFEEYHATAALKVSETVAKSLINDRTIEFTLPEGVEIAGFEISNYSNSTSKLINGDINTFEATSKSYAIDGNVLKLYSMNRDSDSSVTATDLASFNIIFYVVADANYAGDVDVVVSGDALGGVELDAVKVATFAPAFKIATELTTVKSGVQQTAAKDIVISETENGRFQDGETVYVTIDTVSTAVLRNALKIADADVSVTAGDLQIEKVVISDENLQFNITGSSSVSTPSDIKVTNVKVSTAYGLPETTSYPFNVVITTDNQLNGTGNIDGSLSDSAIRYGALTAPYINVKNNTGAASGDVVKVQAGSTTYTVNGEEKTMDAAPFIDAKTSSMMVPVRFIADGVGITEESGNLIWSANNKTVIIRNGNDTIEFPVGSTFYRVNGAVVYNDNSAVTQIVDGRTFVPFRTMGNALAIPVSWDEATRTAQYN